MKSRKNTGNSWNTRGYYIALILCAVAIGISGYVYYRNVNQKEPQLNSPTLDVDVLDPSDDVQAVAPAPTDPDADTKPTTPPKPAMKTGMPVSGQTVAGYAMDCLSYNPTTRDWRVHNGIDIAADAGTEVCAAADGTVYTTYEDDTMGTTVVIRHADGYVTKYSSLAKNLKVAAGDTVTVGQVIGTVGNTALLESAVGDHVHFSVTCNDTAMDPMAFLNLG